MPLSKDQMEILRALAAGGNSSVLISREALAGLLEAHDDLWRELLEWKETAKHLRDQAAKAHQPAVPAVSVALLDPVFLKDTLGREIPGLADAIAPARLYFVDLLPSANWNHPCLYILTSPHGTRVTFYDTPPTEEIEFQSLSVHQA